MEKITHDHLSRPYAQLPDGLESMLHAEKRGGRFYFRAFGEECCLGPEPIRLEPFKSFRDFPNSMHIGERSVQTVKECSFPMCP
jgi:hypothetical protein